MPTPIPERTALYRLYDADDHLLYVGIAFDPEARWQHHANERTWWPEVARRTVEWHDTRSVAAEAEAAAIAGESPRYNGTRTPERLRHYQRIAEALRNEIRGGQLMPGAKLPSEHTLASRFETTRATVRKGVALLRGEGLVSSHQGKGLFVRADPAPTYGAADEVERLRALLAKVRHLLVDDDELYNGGVERAIELLSEVSNE